ncbi:MAG: multiheme c-type cytochrome [Gemmataceae bacterium]
MRFLPARLGMAAFLAVSLAVSFGTLHALTPNSARENPDGRADKADTAGLGDFSTWAGVSSCSASACHNGNFNKGIQGEDYAKRCEYSVWATKDPHQKAYNVLFGEIGRNIERNYQRLAGDTEIHAERDEVCLRCHVDPRITRGPTEAADTPLAFHDGVGCETCHGPAKNWLNDHIAYDWTSLSRAAKEKTGFRYTKSLRVTAETCLECHVGSPRCESGHDLLAAGHPRLNFDFSLAMAQYPKHWSDREDHERYPDYAAQTWAIGSTLVAKAAFDQLAFHTSDGRPWPEFAEHDCYACHHDLKSESWRQTKDYYAGRKPGLIPMNSWYATMASLPVGANPQIDAAINKLSAEMDQTPPDRLIVRRYAEDISRLLGEHAKQMERMHFDEKRLHALYTAVAKDTEKLHRANWDNAAQIYLALAALSETRGDLDSRNAHPGVESLLGRMDDLLGLRRHHAPEIKFNSPRDYLPHAFGKALDDLQRQSSK